MAGEILSNRTTTSDNTMQQAARPPLRRAVYIHVSDLTSAYNIDHKKLEQELSRVNVAGSVTSPPSTQSHPSTTDDASSVTSLPQKRLQPPRGGFNLCVLVGKVNIVVDKLRVDRSRVRLAEVDIGDETGTVSLRARDDQIDVLEEVSNRNGAVVLRNCTLELFQGKHIRLAVTKWGKLNVFPDNVASTPPPPSKINRERNFSLIDLSLVASEMVENQPPEQGGYPGGSREIQAERKVTTNRQPFQTPQQQRVRNPRSADRRQQARPFSGNPLAVPFPEIPMPQMRYGAMPAYGFGDSMEMAPPHYAYGAPRNNPENMQPTAHQLLHLQHQQYELQHRQMQQMQAYHEQQQQQQQQGDRRGHQMQQSQGQSALSSINVDSGPTEFPSLPGAVPTHGESRSRESPRVGAPLARSEAGPWSGRHSFDPNVEDPSGNSPGRMNPQATAFAPSYGTGQQLQSSSPYQGYNPYDSHQRVASPYSHQQHTIYTQNIVYVPVPSGGGGIHAPSAPPPKQEDKGKSQERKS